MSKKMGTYKDISIQTENQNYNFSDFINRKTSIEKKISQSKNLEELFSIPDKNSDLSKKRFVKNIVQPSRAAFKFLLHLNKESRVLDIGCGYGSISTAIAPHVKQITGTDLDLERLLFTSKRAKLSGIKNLKLICTGDSNKLPFSKNSFDTVIINGVLEWIPTTVKGGPKAIQLEFLKEVRRVLKPGGQVYLGIENRLSYQYFLGKPDDHSHLLFGSLLPRSLANLYSKLKRGVPYRTFTYSHKGYQHLSRQAGFNTSKTYFPSPNYKYIEQTYSSSMIHQHGYQKDLSLKSCLINDLRNVLFTLSFLQKFAPSFSFVLGDRSKTSFAEQIIKKHFYGSPVLTSYQVSEKSQEVSIGFKIRKGNYQLKLPLTSQVSKTPQGLKLISKGQLSKQKYFIYQNLSSQTRSPFLRNIIKHLSSRKNLSNLLINFLLKFEPIIPKNSKLVIFGGLNGKFYGDNSKHLFQWLLKHRPQLKPVWLTASPDVFKTLKDQGKPVIMYNSLKGFFILLQAPLACYTNSAKDIFFSIDLLPKNLKLLSLRHGRSVKRVRFARLKHQLTSQEKESRRQEGKKIVSVISTSPFVSKIQEECLQIGADKHVVTGYPRNDHLSKPSTEDRHGFSKLLLGKKYTKVILYAPSWRHGRESTRFFPFTDFSLTELIQHLVQTKTVLLLRPHVNDLLQYPKLEKSLTRLSQSSENIILATHNQVPDAYSLLPFIDILISDYSAAYHDFLLLDRPILLVPYDYTDFKEENGFLYDYKKLAPGPFIKSQKQLIRELKKDFNNQDKFKAKRKKLTNLIYKYQDSKSSQRVAKLIGKILAE